MNKSFYCALILLHFMSCKKETEWSNTNIVRLTNYTNKHLVYYFEANFGSDTLRSCGNDQSEFSVTEVKTTHTFGAERSDIFTPSILYREEIYNLDDTASYIKEIGNFDTMSKNDSLYHDYTNEHTTSSGYKDFVLIYELVYNDTLLAILQKDYTMLDKFKEYYQK